MTLPRGWADATLGDVADFIMGQAPPGSECNEDGDGTPFVKAGEFGTTRPIIREWTTSPLKMATSNDVLICVVGATAGKLNLGADCAIGRSVAAIRPSEATSADFIYPRLKSEVLRLRAASTGTAQGVISREMLGKIDLKLPPLAEQGRIVAKLDALTARVTRARSEIARVTLLAQRLRLAVLEKVFAGCTSGPHTTIADICKVGTGATPKRGEARYYSGGTIPWINSGAVNFGLVLKPAELITEAAIKETNCKVHPAGSLLVALYGEGKTRGKVAILGIDTATNQALAVLHSFDRKRLNPQWLRLFLIGRYEETRSAAAGGVQPNLSLGIIKAIKFPLPSLTEQEAGVVRIEAAFARADRLGAEAKRAKHLLDRLERAILTKAFRGELVPQDPTDEPASALLARIRETREAAPKSARRPRKGHC